MVEIQDFTGGSVVKKSAVSAEDCQLQKMQEMHLFCPGRAPGEGNGNPPQYSCQENPMDRGAWRATVHGVTESDMTEQTHIVKAFRIIPRNK